MFKNKIALTLLLLTNCSSVYADINGPDCSEPDSSGIWVMECDVGVKFKQADNVLNVEYKNLINRIKKEHPHDQDRIITHLKHSQRTWLKFTDKDCQLTAFLNGTGIWRTIAEVKCKIERFEKRSTFFSKF